MNQTLFSKIIYFVLGNDTMKTKSFFKNPNNVRKILVDDLKVMSAAVADAFLESTVNVLEVSVDLGSVVELVIKLIIVSPNYIINS
jgi:hypothetical protein